MGFADKKMACLEAEIVKVTQEMAEAKQMALQVLCVSKLAEEAKKLRKHVSPFETAARAIVSKGVKSPTTMSKRMQADVEANIGKVVWNGHRYARVEASKPRVKALKKQLEHNASRVRVAESKYWLLYDKGQTLKQRLATGVASNGEIEQRMNNASIDVLRNMNVLHLKVVQSQNAVREWFRGIELLARRLHTLFPEVIAASFLTTPGVRHCSSLERASWSVRRELMISLTGVEVDFSPLPERCCGFRGW